MVMNGRGTLSVVATVAALGALVVAPAADAAKGKKKKPKGTPVTVVTASATTTADNQPLAVTATCPAGKIAVGGGFSSPPAFAMGTASDLHLIYESRRSTPNSWLVSAVREDGGATGNTLTLTASVHCRSPKLTQKPKPQGKAGAAKKKKKKLSISEVSTTSSPVGASTEASAAASCPANSKLIGGGFSSAPTPVLGGGPSAFPFFWANYSSAPNSWSASMTNSGATLRTVTGYAYCARGLNPVQTFGSAALPVSGGAFISTASASSCSKERALLGGGFIHSPASIAGGTIPVITESIAVGRAWNASALNLSAVAGMVGARGYCG